MLCVALCAHTQCMFDADTHFMVSMFVCMCVCACCLVVKGVHLQPSRYSLISFIRLRTKRGALDFQPDA